MKQPNNATVTIPGLLHCIDVTCTHHVSGGCMYNLCCMSTDCDTAYCTVLLRNTCLTYYPAWGYTVITLLRNMCYTVNGWHGVCIPSPTRYVTRNGHTRLARKMRRPAPVHGQGRSNKTLGVRVYCRLRGDSGMTTLNFHLRPHSTALPSTHLTSPTFPLPSHIKGQQSTLIRKSSNSHDQT